MSIPLSAVPSLSIVTQTLARVGAAAEYSVHYNTQGDLAMQTAVDWGRCLGQGDVDGLMESIRLHNVTAYLHLNEGRRATLLQLAIDNPPLHSQLQEAATDIERAIGVEKPLNIRAFGEFRQEHVHRKGINLFLNIPEEFSGMALPLVDSPQMLQVDRWAEYVPPPSRRRPQDSLTLKRHSEAIRGHFAEDAIKSLAEYELSGERVKPLRSPSPVFLGPGLTRIGRFTFLGLPEIRDDLKRERNLDALLRFRDQVDVLVLGGASAARPEIMKKFVASLRPQIVLAAGAEAMSLHADTTNHRVTALFAPASSAILHLDPTNGTLDVSSEGSGSFVSWERPDHTMEFLERAHAAATRKVFGNVLVNQRTLLRSRPVLSGVAYPALHYLKQLDASPHLYTTAVEREDALFKIIGKMTGELFPGGDIDHVLAFKELLLQSGLLE